MFNTIGRPIATGTIIIDATIIFLRSLFLPLFTMPKYSIWPSVKYPGIPGTGQTVVPSRPAKYPVPGPRDVPSRGHHYSSLSAFGLWRTRPANSSYWANPWVELY